MLYTSYQWYYHTEITIQSHLIHLLLHPSQVTFLAIVFFVCFLPSIFTDIQDIQNCLLSLLSQSRLGRNWRALYLFIRGFRVIPRIQTQVCPVLQIIYKWKQILSLANKSNNNNNNNVKNINFFFPIR